MLDQSLQDNVTCSNEEERQVGTQPTDAEVPEPTPQRSVVGFKWALLVIAILCSAFLFALDNSIVADVQPRIIQTFPGSIDKLPWLSVAFALGGAASTLVWASTYTTFDARYLYLTSLFLFEVGSALCGAANKIDVLIFARALAGCGGAGMYVGVLTLLSAYTLAPERPIYVASTGLVWGLGAYFKSRTLILQFIEAAAAGGPIFIPVYFIPLFFQFTKGDSPIKAAVRLLPFVCVLVFFSLANGAIMGKEAVAFINLAQIGGLVIALTLANTVFLNVAQREISHTLPTASPEAIKSAISGAGSEFLSTLSQELQNKVLHDIIVAVQKTYILCITTGVLGFVLALGMKFERVFLVM
ncbi:MAG: hypothetical protein Q9212_001594 [Teloschistes hypoglaucus]